MKTDRELNEGAARAAGIRVKWEDVHACFWIEFGQGLTVKPWNPLESAVQATELAAKLKMRTWHSQERACAEYGSLWDSTQHYGSYAQPYAECGGDAVKAMLRAITGAAAAYEPPKEPRDWLGPDLTALQSRSRLGRTPAPVRIVPYEPKPYAAPRLTADEQAEVDRGAA